MTEPLNGLRFDIYERVHLPEDVAAIEELEEIELVPHMQAVPQQDDVLLSGHLLLSGVYRGQQAEEPQQLEHWIPVEITLPLNRIDRVEDIAVEIDNFDIDLLSKRSLNVTGVLALRGLQSSASQSPIWKDDSFTVVHRAEPGQEAGAARDGLARPTDETEPYAAVPPFPGDGIAFEPDREQFQGQPQPSYPGLSGDSDADLWPSGFQDAGEARIPAEQAPAAFQARGEEARPAYPAAEPQQESRWGDLNASQAEDPQPVSEAVEPPKLSVNVASHDASRAQSGVGLLSQLGDIGAKRESELKLLEATSAEEKDAAAKNAPAGSGDEIEWTRLFLSGAGEAQSFRKVRMCIVQRDDTLESIAGRYNVQPRALQLHNRLNDPYLSEGQVLYIP